MACSRLGSSGRGLGVPQGTLCLQAKAHWVWDTRRDAPGIFRPSGRLGTSVRDCRFNGAMQAGATTCSFRESALRRGLSVYLLSLTRRATYAFHAVVSRLGDPCR